tara:strand:+ start:14004 stop:14750 length:747 start_codon:yes stop_codon:yes gene_type:complete
MNLKGKVVLVTGASSGIGFGIAQTLSSYGCKVIINSKSKSKLNNASKKIQGSIPISADLSCNKQAKHFAHSIKEYTKNIDILVCNIGNSSSVVPGKESYQEWTKMFDSNFYTTTNIIENTKKMISKNTGSIVCISSICGIDYIDGAPITYSVAKAALNHYIKLSSRIFANDGIRINGVAPGNILFENSVWDKKLKKDKKAVTSLLNKNVAMKRLGTIDEISAVVAFLSSDKASFITGTIIPVDGGQLR